MLVTGASGFLGSRTAVMMLEKGLAVKGFDIRPQNPPIKGLDFIQGDIRNLDDCKRAAEGVDAIFHCAAIAQLAKGKLLTAHHNLVAIQRCLVVLIPFVVQRVKSNCFGTLTSVVLRT